MSFEYNFSWDDYTGQGKFRFWCQKVLPLVYDDSLSYYELLCKVVNYLNNTIADVAAVENNVDETRTAFVALENYVNNYFDSLDVQNEINAKLDAMAESGELSALITPLVPTAVGAWLTEHLTPTEPPVDDTLTIEGAAADAKTVGDLFHVSLKFASFDGGTACENQTPNTICDIPSSDIGSLTDAPEGIAATNVHAWLVTYGADTYPQMQYMFSTRLKHFYSRVKTSNGFTQWVSPIQPDTTLSVSGDAADSKTVGDALAAINSAISTNDAAALKLTNFDGGTHLENQTANTVCNVSSSAFVNIQDTPADIQGQSMYAWVFTVGEIDSYPQFQMLYTTKGHLFYFRFKRSQGWTNWAYVINVDSTLSVAGDAADAKATGDRFTTDEANITKLFNDDYNALTPIRPPFFRWIFGKTINEQGNIATAAGACYTSNQMSVKPGTPIKSYVPNSDDDSIALYTYIHIYSGGVWQSRVQLNYEDVFYTPDGCDSVGFNFGYKTTAGINITYTILEKYFNISVGLYPSGLRNAPVGCVVGIGASTTFGTIKDYGTTPSTAGSHEPTIYPWPEYLAETLGMNCINLGVGTTGFLCRDDGTRTNFLDRILANDKALKRASLIVLAFGYGNDSGISYDGNTYSLPAGTYQDFYPYDTDTIPSGNAAIPYLINNGYTLMGALNWCFKYLGTHYPDAQFIPVFVSPSENKSRTITITNTDEQDPEHIIYEGNAPQFLTFTDPYASPQAGSDAETEKAISTELAKLRNALNVPIIDLVSGGGGAFTWWATTSTETFTEGGVDYNRYCLFSTRGTMASPDFDTHPNDRGYARYSRDIAGRIAQYFKYKF